MKKKKENWEIIVEKNNLKPTGKIKRNAINLFKKEGSLSYRELWVPRKYSKQIFIGCIIIGFCIGIGLGLFLQLPFWYIILIGIFGAEFGFIGGLGLI